MRIDPYTKVLPTLYIFTFGQFNLTAPKIDLVYIYIYIYIYTVLSVNEYTPFEK